jgi:hypothetical protein
MIVDGLPRRFVDPAANPRNNQYKKCRIIELRRRWQIIQPGSA